MTIIGVDLGLTGGVATLTEDGELIDVVGMPVLRDGTKGRATICPALLAEIFAASHSSLVYVEWVGPRPHDGCVASFAFGHSKGTVQGVAAALGLRVQFLTPPVWKRTVGLPPGREGAKDRSRSAAIARWPDKASLFKLKKSDGLAEAALIGWAGLPARGAAMNHGADAERARLKRLYPDIFNDGARCAFHQRHPGRREPGGYPLGFREWEPEARDAWHAGYNFGRLERERGLKELGNG